MRAALGREIDLKKDIEEKEDSLAETEANLFQAQQSIDDLNEKQQALLISGESGDVARELDLLE